MCDYGPKGGEAVAARTLSSDSESLMTVDQQPKSESCGF